MKAELVPENGDPPIPITRDVTVIGRREFCDVRIDHASLSKRHCVVVKTDGLLVIRDLATTNGTKVKGQRIRWAALLPDDRVSLGAYKMRVYLGPDDVPGPSERYVARASKPAAAAAVTSGAPSGGFAAPSPLEIPALDALIDEDDDGLEILDTASTGSSLRHLIASSPRDDDPRNLVIDLD